MEKLELKIAELFVKFPQLPEKTRLMIVRFAPWGSLFFALILAAPLLALIGLGGLLLPFSFLTGGIGHGFAATLQLILSVATLALDVVAIPGLFKRSRQGWTFSFYALLLSGVADLLSGQLFGLVMGTGLGLYFLFQVRSYYNGTTTTAGRTARLTSAI